MTIDFLLRCIDTVGVLVDRQAVHLLLHWKIFKFAKVIWIEFLKYRNGSAVARNVNAFQTGVIFHHVRSVGQRQESYGLMLFQIKNRHQFVSFTCQKSSPVLGVKRHSVIPVASPNAVAPDNLIRLRVYHHKNILILEIDIDLAGNGIVLWHPSFAIEMESLDNLVLLDINNGLCLPPLVRNLELVVGSSILAAVGFSFRWQFLNDLHLLEIDYANRVVASVRGIHLLQLRNKLDAFNARNIRDRFQYFVGAEVNDVE